MIHLCRMATLTSLVAGMMMTGRAQVTLTVEKIDTTLFPQVSIHFVTQVDGILRRDLNASNFSVTEETIPQGPISYQCPQGNSEFSLAILIGRGSSFNQSLLDMSKGAADAVVSSMDGGLDEASLMTYASIISTDVFLTNDKVLLQNGINGLTLIPAGQNRFWDGLATAVTEISSNGTNTTKAVLVLSNGEDDASTNSLNSVLSLAVGLGIKVYCVGIGVGSGGAANLQSIATGTGGKYWPGPTGGWEQSFINLLRGTPEACVLQYTTNSLCRDGFAREVNIEATTGGKSGSVDASYTMSQDPTSYQNALFSVDTASVTGGRMKQLPLMLQTPLNNGRFYAAHITLAFDTSKLRLLTVNATGSLLEDLTINITGLSTGARVDIAGVKKINGSGVLFRLVFETSDVQQAINVPISMTTFLFDRGCLIPQLSPGSILLLPKVHAITHQTEGPPPLVWNPGKKEYDSNPFAVTVHVKNAGDLPLTDIRGTIQTAPGLQFLPGYGTDQVAQPANLDTAGQALLRWEMRTVPQTAPRLFQLPFSVTCAEGVRTSGTVEVAVEQAGALLSMDCTAPPITVENNDYKPNPFSVTLRVRNSGGTSSAPTAQIVLPPGLALENDQEFKPMTDIQPSDSGSVHWNVRAVKSSVGKDYSVSIIIRGTGIRADTCSLTVTTPPLGAVPVITTMCLTSPVIAYDAGMKRYLPNPFTSEAVLHNTGLARSDSLSVRLVLPGELEGAVTVMKIPGIGPNDSARVEWTIHIPALVCTLTTARMIMEVSSGGQILETCHTDLTLPAKQNIRPSIDSHEPPRIDTVRIGESVIFSVTANDPDGDSLRYTWIVNGQIVAVDSSIYTRQFNTTGNETVICLVNDGCGMDSVLWQYVVDTPLSTSGMTLFPGGYALYQNYPNPVHLRNNGGAGTTIGFHVPAGEHRVELHLLDVTGRIIGTIAEGLYTGGSHYVSFDRFPMASDRTALQPGIYFYRMISGTFITTRAFLLLP